MHKLSAIFLLLLAGCDYILIEKGPNGISYFVRGKDTDLAKCPPQVEDNWYQAEFTHDGLDHTFVSPLGLICAKDAQGRYVRAYVDASNKVATHKLEEGGSVNFIPVTVFKEI